MMENNFLDDLGIPPPPFSSSPKQEIKAESDSAMKLRLETEALKSAFHRVEGIYVYQCNCQKCGYVWMTMKQVPPPTCSRCHSAYWWKPQRMTPRGGRPRKDGADKADKIYLRARKKPKKRVRQEVDKKKSSVKDDIHEVKMAEVGALGGPIPVSAEGSARVTPEGERTNANSPHGDYGILVSSLIGEAEYRELEVRQPFDDGGGENIDDSRISQEGDTRKGISEEAFQITRVDAASVPRTTGPKKIEVLAQERTSNLKPEDFIIRRVTREEIDATVTEVPIVPMRTVEIDPVALSNANGDVHLARYADTVVPKKKSYED